MKNRLLFFLLLLKLSVSSQDKVLKKDNSFSNKKNEIRVEPFKALTSNRLHLTYEYFLKNKFSIGLSIATKQNQDLLRFRSPRKNYDESYDKLQLIPFVRYRLTKNPRNNLFLESYFNFNKTDFTFVDRVNTGFVSYYNYSVQEINSIGVGGSVGYKFYIFKHIPLEYLVGFNTNSNKKASVSSNIRVGLQVGYRF